MWPETCIYIFVWCFSVFAHVWVCLFPHVQVFTSILMCVWPVSWALIILPGVVVAQQIIHGPANRAKRQASLTWTGSWSDPKCVCVCVSARVCVRVCPCLCMFVFEMLRKCVVVSGWKSKEEQCCGKYLLSLHCSYASSYIHFSIKQI